MLSPSPDATDGATSATRRETWVTGFDCGAGAVLLRAPPHRPGDRAPIWPTARGFSPSSFPRGCARGTEGRKTMTSSRQDWAASRRGELNRERGSRRLSAAINAETAPDRWATGWCLDQSGPVRSERSRHAYL